MNNAPRSVCVRQSYESLGGRHSLKVTWVAASVKPSLHSQTMADSNINDWLSGGGGLAERCMSTRSKKSWSIQVDLR